MSLTKFKFQKRLFFAHSFHKLRIIPCWRYQKVFYKIVVVNRNNSILEVVGFINPFSVPLRLSYRDITKPFLFSKIIGVNRIRVMFWLSKGVLATPTVFVILNQMGLTKTQSIIIKNEFNLLSRFFFRRSCFDSFVFNDIFQQNKNLI